MACVRIESQQSQSHQKWIAIIHGKLSISASMRHATGIQICISNLLLPRLAEPPCSIFLESFHHFSGDSSFVQHHVRSLKHGELETLHLRHTIRLVKHTVSHPQLPQYLFSRNVLVLDPVSVLEIQHAVSRCSPKRYLAFCERPTVILNGIDILASQDNATPSTRTLGRPDLVEGSEFRKFCS